MSSLKKNFLFNATYQVLGLIVPLVLTPYVSRVLGPEGVGTYSYTYSIVYYFMLVALLGMQYYGNRTVAKARENREELSKKFWEIYSLQFIVTFITSLVYVGFILFNKEYQTIYIIEMPYVISVAFDINWLYSGLEKFKFTVTRSAIIRVLSAIAIFVFVKGREDVWIYVLILSGSTLLNQVVLWPTLFKYVDFKKVRIKSIFKHLKPTIVLFIPVLAFSVYNVMDKIMLGMMTSTTQVGYYENAEKIINIPFYIVSALGTVTLPRISNLSNDREKNKEKIKEIIEKSIIYILFLLIPMMFGIFAVADYFVPLYLGNEFNEAIIPLKLLAVILIFKSISQIIRQQYLVPMEKDNVYIKATVMGAILNLIINWILIPKYKVIGACIATVITEIITSIYQINIIEKDMRLFKEIIKDILIILIKSTIMFICIISLGTFIEDEAIRNILQVVIACIIYGLLNLRFIKKQILPLIIRKKGA